MSKKLLAVVGCCLTALVAFGALFARIFSDGFDSEQKLTLASQWLDEGRWDLAAQMAKELEPSLDTQSNSRWHYVVGVAKLQSIQEELDSAENRRTLLEATEHLTQSREIGFPVGLTGKGQYYLGFCRFHTYQWEGAIEALGEAIESHPEKRSGSLHMIFLAQLRKPRPDLAKAAETLSRWESIPGKSSGEAAQALLAQAQLAYKQKKFTESLNWIEKISPDLPSSFEGRVWQALCNIELALAETAEEKRQSILRATHDFLKRQIFAADTPVDIRRQSSYLLGRTLRLENKLTEAAGALSIVRQQNPNSAEAIAACMEEAEILVELGQSEEAMATTLNLLKGIQDISLYNDYWMPLDTLRFRLVNLGDRLREESDYDKALKLADMLGLAFQPAYSLRLQATTYAAWANKLSVPDQVQQSSEVTNLFGKAGDTFERLAMVELRSPEYLNIIWNAAENYQKANRIESAQRMYKTYMQYETRSRQPRGLIAIGKNYIAQGDWEASIDPLQRCLDYYGSSPSCYEARLLLAQAMAEQNKLDEAIELLSENLWEHDLSPESSIWRDSSVELANLFYQRGSRLLTRLTGNPPTDWREHLSGLQTSHNDILKGIEQFNQVVVQFPDDSRHFHSRYLLAQSYRLAAELPRIVFINDTSLMDSARRQYTRRRRELMESAIEEFRGLLADIQKSPELDTLAPAILKNAYFGEADALAAIDRHDDAIQAYKNTASYYVNQPEALEALVQIAECQKKMGRVREAQRALRQAQQLLQRIPPDHDARFISSTRGDRNHWRDLLGWMNQQYNM